MRRTAPFLFLLGLAAGCSSTAGPDLGQFEQPNALLRSEIQRRIDQIPYQRGTALVMNLAWIAARGEAAIPQLLQAMKSKDPKVRAEAAWTLGRIRDTRTIPFLRKYLDDPDPTVEMEVARALLTMGDDSGVPHLIMGLQSKNPRYRYYCFEALKYWSGLDFGYDPKAKDQVARETATRKWMEWWNRKAGKPVFPVDRASDAFAAPPAGGAAKASEARSTGKTGFPAFRFHHSIHLRVAVSRATWSLALGSYPKSRPLQYFKASKQ